MPRRPSSRLATWLLRTLPRGLLWAIAAVTATGAGHDELGIPVVQSFGPRDYGAHNQTWTAVQDAAGMVYVGNKDRVLAYDGQTWRSFATGGLFVRGLALDADDRIWIGGVGEVGYLEPDGTGSRRYVSLRDQMPARFRDRSSLYFTRALSHGVYWAGVNGVFRWHDGEFTDELTGASFMWTRGDELIVSRKGEPLLATDGTAWRVLLDGDPILNDWVPFGIGLPDGSQVIFSMKEGAFRLIDGRLEPWPTEIDATMHKFFVHGGAVLPDNRFALRLRQGGLAVLDQKGKLIQHFSAETQSLPVTNTLGFGEETAGGLWATLNSGLARIDSLATVTHFDERRGLGTNTVKAIQRHRGRLYVATGDGLSVLQPRDSSVAPPAPAHFVPVEGIDDAIWALTVAGDDLLIGGSGGVHRLTPGGNSTLPAIEFEFCSALLTPQNDEGFAWAGFRGALCLLRRDAEGWHIALNFPEIDGDVRALAEDTDGSIWVSVDGMGYVRLVRAPGQPIDARSTWRVESYPGGHGLTSPEITGLPGLATRGNRAVFNDDRTIFGFDPASNRFVPLIAATEQFDHPIAELPTLATGLHGALWVRTLRDDPAAGPWNGRVYWRVSADGRWQALPFTVAERVGENPMLFEETTAHGSVLWIGGSEGLVRVELPAAFVTPRPFHTVIRQVSTLTDTPLSPFETPPLELPFNAQGLAFHFATDRVDDPGMRFQTRFRSYGETWSPLSPVAELTLNHQPAGQHTIEVRARDSDGRLGEIAAFTYVVLPPWWQSWWMRSIWVLVAVGAGVLIIRWRLDAAQRRNQVLAELVAQRTRQLRANEAQLVQARDSANAANHAKSAFLASMSHELRTPLNAILGFTQLLRRESGLSPKGRTQLETVNRNGRHLLEMINEVLDLSKIEANKLSLRLAPCSLPKLAEELRGTFEPRAREKGLRLRLDVAPLLPPLMADEPKLRQVLINLLANAVKFTSQGEIVLVIQRNLDRLRFEVRDTGVGIAPEELASVFEPFHQSQPATDPESEAGTGLGLPISQRLVELMGGRITVTSNLGQGSTFAFDLTFTTPPDTPRVTPARRVTGYIGRRRHVLIVDDVETNRTILSEMLGNIGFITQATATGEDALDCHARHPADLVLLDLRLPGMDGEDVAQRLRPAGQTTPRLIAVSASVFDVDQTHAREVGCDAFVPKPVDETELLNIIARELDLQWTTEPLPPASSDSGAPFSSTRTDAEIVALPLPSRADLQSWLELARRSDQRNLRDAVAADGATGPDATFRQEIDLRLKRFRTGEVREILAQALDRPPPPAS